jgi:hypothetical protein
MISALLFAALTLPAAQAQAQGWPSVSDPAVASKEGAKDAALVIAIEDYFVAQDIPGAVQNGRDWATWLEQGRGVPLVKTLLNQQAVRPEMLAEAVKVAKQVQPGGRMWLIYIGHGAPSERGDDGLLVGVDAQQTPASIADRGLPRAELLRAVEAALPAGAEVVLVQDACFSGKHARGDLAPGMAPMKVVGATLGAKVTVLAAARSDEYAGPLSDGTRPAFSYLVLGALRGWGDKDGDKVVTAKEAVDYANRALVQTVTGRSQTAELSGPDLSLGRGGKERGPKLTAVASTAVVSPPAPAPVSMAKTSVPATGADVSARMVPPDTYIPRRSTRGSAHARVPPGTWTVPLSHNWAVLGLPINDGQVLKSDSKALLIAYEDGAISTYTASYQPAITEAGYKKAVDRSSPDFTSILFTKGTQQLGFAVKQEDGFTFVLLEDMDGAL